MNQSAQISDEMHEVHDCKPLCNKRVQKCKRVDSVHTETSPKEAAIRN
jgi:hypothetical protein